MQPRKCPQCGKTIQNESGHSFDKNLNLICGKCGKVAFPTDYSKNNEIDQAIRALKGGGWLYQTHFHKTPDSEEKNEFHRLPSRGSQVPSLHHPFHLNF